MFGPRIVLTIAITAWSLCTAATSIAGGAAVLLTVRLGLGVCEAGAYPAAAGLVRKWASAEERGRLSSIVAFGGRIGGAVAPVLTALVAVRLLGDPATGARGWRGVFLLYGLLGLAAAAIFWVVARDTPAEAPVGQRRRGRPRPAGRAGHRTRRPPWLGAARRPGRQPEHVAVRGHAVLRQRRLGVPRSPTCPAT